MCPRLAVLVALAAAVAPPVEAGQTFPYKAYATTNEVYVRSGPGENYYPTGKLQVGDAVEVYRHDPGGWCAIRPPAGSFSWLSARYIKPGKEGLAEVIGDRVAARVGSQLSDIRDCIQVRLERGETVEVLGAKPMAGGDSATAWYKIAPPAGEFRWVHGKYLDPDFRRDGNRKGAAEPNSPTPPSRKARTSRAEAAEASSATWSPIGNEPAARSSGKAGREGAFPNRRGGRGEELAWPTPAPAKRLTRDEFQAELDDINSELAIMLAEEPTVWNCEELSRRANVLVEQAEMPDQRGHARVLVNRIAHAEDVKRRSDTIGGAGNDLLRSGGRLADLGPGRTRGLRAHDAEDQFDGVGRLTVVQGAKLGAPRYALVDDQGSILTYITPAPGMNLRYYLGRRIGINGVRGYLAEQDADLLTAKHVTMLDSRLR